MRRLLLEKKKINDNKLIEIFISDDEKKLFVKTRSEENGRNLTLEKIFNNNSLGSEKMEKHIELMSEENALTLYFCLGE